MSYDRYRYTFTGAFPFQDVEATIMIALFGTQALHGETRTRLDARYVFDTDTRTCVIDATTEAGQHFNELFTEYCRRSFGDDAFKIERIYGGLAAERSAA
jgi:hypothetical protein